MDADRDKTIQTLRINNRKYIRSEVLAGLLNITVEPINAFCDEFLEGAESSFKSSVEILPIDGVMVYTLDFFAFYDFTQAHPEWVSEENSMAVRMALGEYRERPEVCPFNAGDPMSCQKEWCECADPGSFTFAERVA